MHRLAASAPGTVRLFEADGTVASGLGQGRMLTQLDWVLAQLRRHFDWPVHPGTFNLRLQGPRWAELRSAMHAHPGLVVEPPAGFCAAKCFRARVGAARLPAAVVLPEVDGYPPDQLELVASVNLRQALNVVDGARVPLLVEA